MNRQELFERVLVSLQEAALDGALWPSASALLDEACGVVGNSLYVGEGFGREATINFAGIYSRGQRFEEFERQYIEVYHSRDERVPRLRTLPDSKLVHVRDVYWEQELKTSAAYNEAVAAVNGQNGLHVRLNGPHGSRIIWTLHDPVQPDGWGSDQVKLIEHIAPHIRQCVRVRQALAVAEATGALHSELLANTRIGAIELDGRARMLRANDRALKILRQGDGLSDQGGVLRARSPADNEQLQQLLARALPAYGGQGVGGSLRIRRTPGRPPFTLHISPVSVRQMDFGARRVAGLALIVEQERQRRIDPHTVAAALGLTPAESRIAAALANGSRVRDIAAATGSEESTVRWHINRIFRKHGVSRQAELVHLVLSSLDQVPG